MLLLYYCLMMIKRKKVGVGWLRPETSASRGQAFGVQVLRVVSSQISRSHCRPGPFRQELFSRLDAWMLESFAPGRATGHHSDGVLQFQQRHLPRAYVRNTRVIAISKARSVFAIVCDCKPMSNHELHQNQTGVKHP